ncbi:hypothetical protein SORBI_3003G083100 [Sorghum bicolor]|uniref:Uncharacterized protein n=1 Tax=Sorghum bicolor TaxID=4558 RepID=A0A1B6Q211_SORBI|nr:hypothetical protein SORBI_3003G083100 [Sorghum bicolor]
MASTLPVRTHRHTGHAMAAASASPVAKHSPQRERCLQGRSTMEAGLRRQPRHAQSDNVPGPVDSTRPASLAAASSSTDAHARGCGVLELRMQGDRGGLLRQRLGLPRRRLAVEAREPLLQLGAVPRLALRFRRLLAQPAHHGLVVSRQPIGHR